MAANDSISKGVFAFGGRKRKLDVGSYMAGGESARYAKAQKVWLKCHNIIEEIQDASCKSIFDDICAHVVGSNAARNESSDAGVLSVVDQLPVAALVSGASAPDHTYLFTSLAKALRIKASSHVAIVRSKDCSTLKTLVNSIGVQLTAKGGDGDASPMKAAQCTMSYLKSWYRKVLSYCKERDSPLRGPVVIILEDFESFKSDVVQDLIMMCSYHFNEMPTVLVFGLATDVTMIHRTLANNVTSLLAVQKFQAVSSNETLSKLLEEVLLKADAPFKLGGKVFDLLLDMFLYHDFSIAGFTHCFRLCILDHFLTNGVSHLCCDIEEAANVVKALSQQQVEEVLSLPSMRAYVERRPPSEQVQLLKDGKFAKKTIHQLIRDMAEYHGAFFVMLRVLHLFTSQLPGHPLGKRTRELYALSLMGVTLLEGYKLALSLLRGLSKDELIAQLSQCIELVKGEPHENLDGMPTALAAYIKRLRAVGASEPQEECRLEADSQVRKLDMYTLRKTLLEQRQSKVSYFEKLRNEIVDFLDSVWQNRLKPYAACPLHEVYYYGSATFVRQHCNASPRMAIHTALAKPYYYIENEQCNVSVDSIVPTLPDVCIAYKLHLGCARLINLHDWMLAFAAVCEESSDQSSRNSSISPVAQARFVRAVSELQFLGFIKPTKAKTDHVTRLTWGTC